MRTELASPKTLKPGDRIVVVSSESAVLELVAMEIGRVTPIKRDDKVVAYKVYPQRWIDDQDAVARTAALKMYTPKTYPTRSKVEKVVAP